MAFGYQKFGDTIRHVVSGADTLFSLAAVYYPQYPTPAMLWWVIGDFQPDPIRDPTLILEVGRILHIPSSRVLAEKIFVDDRIPASS